MSRRTFGSIAALVSVVNAIWIYAAWSGTTNAAGWFGAGLAVIFTIGWAYYLLADRRIESRVVTATPRA